MSNPSMKKGTSWESLIVDYLKANGVPYAERRRPNGARDRGDISGVPGVVIEAKAERPYRLGEWLAEAERERLNDGAEVALVWAKRVGRASAADGVIVMTPATLLKLLGARSYIATGMEAA